MEVIYMQTYSWHSFNYVIQKYVSENKIKIVLQPVYYVKQNSDKHKKKGLKITIGIKFEKKTRGNWNSYLYELW